MTWAPLHCHSHFSLLDAISKPEQIVARCRELGYAACALTDHGTLAGVPAFVRAMAEASLKPVAGCEFYVCDGPVSDRSKGNARLSHLCVLARHQAGWKALVRASSDSAAPEHFYRRPRLDLDALGRHSGGGWAVFSGHLGSGLADALFDEPSHAYRARTYEEAAGAAAKGWEGRAWALVQRYQALFGADNFSVEVQLVDRESLPSAQLVADRLRWLAGKRGLRCVATADSHYPRPEDAADQRVLLCTSLNTTLSQVRRRMEAEEDVSLGGFFRSNRYHIPSEDEMRALHPEAELAEAARIAAGCEPPRLAGRPLLPPFRCPPGVSEEAHLRALCERGWDRKVARRVPEASHARYRERLEAELSVLLEAGLASYFLITADFVRHARDDLGAQVGEGRGSAAGCMVSYLLDITNVDPEKHHLLFERFYTAGRNVPEHVAFDELRFS